MMLTATPYRVSFFGGGTDYPEWFQTHGGCVLGMAINHYCYVAVKPLPPFYGDTRYRIVYAKVEDQRTGADIEHPAVRGVLQHLQIDTPLEIAHMSDLPARAGLGASSAFVVGLLHTLRLQARLGLGSVCQLASEAIRVEREVIKEAVGCQDQIMTACAGLSLIEFHAGTGDRWTRHQILLPAERLHELESSLVLAYTGTMRNAHTMASKQIEKVGQSADHFAALMALARTAHLTLLDERRPLAQFGKLLNEAWQHKRRICDGLATPGIDELYDRGMRGGALGGKLLGAGGGGFMLFFVPPVQRAQFMLNIGVPCVTVKLDTRGTRQIVTP